MQLLIRNKNKMELSQFSSYLVECIQHKFISDLDNKKLIVFNRYLQEQKEFMPCRYLSIRNILIGCIYNLKVNKNGQDIVIQIDPNQVIPNTNLRYITFAKLVNYGVVRVPPYPIFDNIFKFVANNIDGYYQAFIVRRG